MGKLYENLKNLQGEIKLRAFDISFICCYGINLVLEGFHLFKAFCCCEHRTKKPWGMWNADKSVLRIMLNESIQKIIVELCLKCSCRDKLLSIPLSALRL